MENRKRYQVFKNLPHYDQFITSGDDRKSMLAYAKRFAKTTTLSVELFDSTSNKTVYNSFRDGV